MVSYRREAIRVFRLFYQSPEETMNNTTLHKIRPFLQLEPGIHGKEEYFNSVVLLLLIPVGCEYHMVFEKRNAGIRQGGEICFPGGRYEPSRDISPEKTALRETREELGIPEAEIKIIGRLDTILAPMGTTVDVFMGTSEVGLDEMRINPDEVEKVFAIPVTFFEEHDPEEYRVMVNVNPAYTDEKTGREIVLLPSRELGLPEKYWKPWGGFKYKVFLYQTDEGPIWGITARVILDFLRRLRIMRGEAVKGEK